MTPRRLVDGAQTCARNARAYLAKRANIAHSRSKVQPLDYADLVRSAVLLSVRSLGDHFKDLRTKIDASPITVRYARSFALTSALYVTLDLNRYAPIYTGHPNASSTSWDNDSKRFIEQLGLFQHPRRALRLCRRLDAASAWLDRVDRAVQLEWAGHIARSVNTLNDLRAIVARETLRSA